MRWVRVVCGAVALAAPLVGCDALGGGNDDGFQAGPAVVNDPVVPAASGMAGQVGGTTDVGMAGQAAPPPPAPAPDAGAPVVARGNHGQRGY